MLIGEGDASPNGDAGHLFIVFENLPSEGNRFKREGANIVSDLKITLPQSQKGDRVSVKTISGASDVIILPGTKRGDRLVIRDKGLPSFNPRECFKVLAGTCRDRRSNVIRRMGLHMFSSQAKGHHIVCIGISDTIING